MNFCQNYFSKDLDQLTESDLVTFFSIPQKETQYIEFKSFGEPNVEQVFNKTLKPAVCSFLNSEGGILIYGAPREDRRNSDNPENFRLRPYPSKFLGDHDSIIRKIADGITPMPVGVRLKEVEVEGGVVAVFEIQESQSKPHQTDNIYQIRIDGQKKPAPHYLIEAMMKQVRFPSLECSVVFQGFTNDAVGLRISLVAIAKNTSEFQNESDVFIDVKCKGAHVIKSQVWENHIPVLSFGLPKHQRFDLTLSIDELNTIKLPLNLQLVVFFGGRSAPVKISAYVIMINTQSINSIKKDSIQITLRDENLSPSEYKSKEPYTILKTTL
ncbi:MAG: ATP-binding protein [Algoriphagus aquaeductus]|uniref:ATP-binding protein n=1 Tax=Algoriphagus aquaeductus TaxID=475299 RepID=UPI00387A5E25